MVVDDVDAEKVGQWTSSRTVGTFVGDGYIHAKGPDALARFTLKAPADGAYQLRISHTAAGNRASNVPIALVVAGKTTPFQVDQQKPPSDGRCFHEISALSLKAGEAVIVEISTRGTDGVVIVDAVQLVTAEQLAQAAARPAKASPKPVSVPQPAPKVKPAVNPAPAAAAKPPATAPAQPIAFERKPTTRPVAALSPAQLDELTTKAGLSGGDATPDEQFLRRVTLDLIGRQPMPQELAAFLSDTSPRKRETVVDRLLGDESFGVNWANYWSDVIAARQEEPELTFYDYTPFRAWLAGQINAGAAWDAIVHAMLTASGKVGDRPETTFIGFHQGNANRLAGETTRVFLGQQIACAECHDHPFDDSLTQEMFHGVAAFFARAEAKIAQLDSAGIEIKSKVKKDEQQIPGRKRAVPPQSLAKEASLELGAEDPERRAALARWVVQDNPQFARAYVNRVWWYLLGEGLVEPIDDMPLDASGPKDQLLSTLAGHFMATQYDSRGLFRLIVGSRLYQQTLLKESGASGRLAPSPRRLRGDEVFASLVRAIELPNVTPPREKKSSAVRFPPPPKSTRDLVNDAFGFDPSMDEADVPRTMKQAMFMMNNLQLQAQINADPNSGTWLAKMLAAEADNAAAVVKLYEAVLARRPSEVELKTALTHLQDGARGPAFEDLLWALLNTAEFGTRP